MLASDHGRRASGASNDARGDPLKKAEDRGLLNLELDERSGGYVILAVHCGE